MAKQTPSPANAFRNLLHDALEPLAAEERQRVVASVLALFGTAVQGATRPPPGAAPTMTSTAAATTTSRPLSLIEFMDEKKPVSNPQKIAAFAFYRERYEGAPRFARADLSVLPQGKNRSCREFRQGLWQGRSGGVDP